MAGIREDWFPTSIWRFDHPEPRPLEECLLGLIRQERQRDPAGRAGRSNPLGWQSQDDLPSRPEWGELTNFLVGCVAEVVRFLHWDPALVAPVLSNAWAVVNSRHSGHAAHVHPQAFLSGVYYVQAPEGCGNLFFLDPRTAPVMAALPVTQATPWTHARVAYAPRPGRVLLFPSWLYHGVEPNLNDEERISVSFNVGVRWLRQ